MIGIAVVGYGYWGPNLVRNFSEDAGRSPGLRVRPQKGPSGDRAGALSGRGDHRRLRASS